MEKLYVVGAMFSYSCSDAIMKVLMNNYSIYTSNTIRAAIRLVLILSNLRSIAFRSLKLHIVYWILSFLRTYCFLYAVKHVDITTIAMINYSCSIFTLIISSILKETATRKQYISVIICIIGLYIGLKPKFNTDMLNVAITTLGGLVTSVDKFLLQRLLKNNNITTITTGSNLFMIVTSGIFTSIEMPCLNDLVVFIVAGVLGLVGQVFSTKATRLGNHSQLAPYYYSIFIFGVGIECLIHGNLPSLRNLIATGIIVSAMVINK